MDSNASTFAALEKAATAAPLLMRGALRILLSLLVQFDARLRAIEEKKNGG